MTIRFGRVPVTCDPKPQLGASDLCRGYNRVVRRHAKYKKFPTPKKAPSFSTPLFPCTFTIFFCCFAFVMISFCRLHVGGWLGQSLEIDLRNMLAITIQHVFNDTHELNEQ
jgi:hypothetical protein